MSKLCPICEEGTLTDKIETRKEYYIDKWIEFDCHYSLCSLCGEQANAEQSRKNKEIILKARGIIR